MKRTRLKRKVNRVHGRGLTKIKYGTWKGVVVYTQYNRFTKSEIAKWKKYAPNIKQYFATDINRYVIGIMPKE